MKTFNEFMTESLNVNGFEKIVYLFLKRDHGFSDEDAKIETNIIKNLGMSALKASSKNSKLENDLYIKASRVGAKRKLTRPERVDIALSINNAINHANFGSVK